MSKRIWDNFKELGEVQKSASTKFIISVAAKDGVKYLNVREFYMRKADNTWHPSRNGIVIPVALRLDEEHAIAPVINLIDQLSNGIQSAVDLELFSEEGAVYKVD